MTSIPKSAFRLAGCLALVVLSHPCLHAAGVESPLNQLMSAPGAALLNSLRPHLVRQLASGVAPGALANPPPSRFHPNGNRLLVAQVVHALSRETAAEQVYLKAIEQAFANYEQQAAAGGLAHDVAGTLALFVAAAELGSTGTEMTDAQSEVVAHQLQLGLDTPEMRQAPDQVKQELYEFFATFGFYLLVTRQVAIEGHNDHALAQLKPLAAQSLGWLLQVAPESIRLTDRGLSVPAVANSVAAPATPSPAGSVSAPTAVGETGPKSLVGLWHGVGMDSSFTATPGASGTGFSSYGIKNGLKGKDLAFLPNGWFCTVLPSTGLANVDPAKAAAASPYYWGHYTFDGRHGMLNFIAGGPEPFEYVDGKILFHKFEYTPRGPLK